MKRTGRPSTRSCSRRSAPPIDRPAPLDEDFPLDTAKALREQGFVVVATVETEVRGLKDIDQLRRATELGAILVSNNYTERYKFFDYARQLQQARITDVAAVLLPHEPPGRCCVPRCWSPGTRACRSRAPR